VLVEGDDMSLRLKDANGNAAVRLGIDVINGKATLTFVCNLPLSAATVPHQ
jgi:hypothetical protein